MSSKPIRCTLVGGAVVALAVVASPAAFAAEPDRAAAADQTPVVVAQAAAPATGAPAAAVPAEAFPSYQRGVRQAAAEGTLALRRYLWRTRMIYNFYYNDFAPRE
ncbi:MAG TPA: hypothetical protein VF059_11060 [Casimicrobiaceae bacterium]